LPFGVCLLPFWGCDALLEGGAVSMPASRGCKPLGPLRGLAGPVNGGPGARSG